jgi:hypothetical protein
MRLAATKKNLQIMYELPLVYRGLPLYNIVSCKRYVSKVLRSQDFECSDAGARFLLISWKAAMSRPAVIAKEQKLKVKPPQSRVPPLPPIFGNDDLFAIPSFGRLNQIAKSLKH